MITLIALCALLQQPQPQPKPEEDPVPVRVEKDPWAGLKVGSWVKIKVVSGPAVGEVKLTLSEIADDRKRIIRDPAPEVKPGQDDGTWTSFVPFSAALKSLGLKVARKGQEVLKIGGKARFEDYEPENLGAIAWVTKCRVWYSDQVPGGIAKITTQVESLERPEKWSYEAVAVEKLKIKGKEVSCVRFRVEHTFGKGQKTEANYWLSDDVPGLVVKLQAKTTSGKKVVEHSVEVTDFEAKKE